ncbi:hypothetical protein IU433_13935 [Nocardia puris]|uniref:hypothetical protein n=1 Tax=Nocardia puris TaxID=208602 RepID=UPI00189473E6|nr:hypothetical protein [Nocardia puris]MBF6460136.1 hypothetical protein [Nocardia puris]
MSTTLDRITTLTAQLDAAHEAQAAPRNVNALLDELSAAKAAARAEGATAAQIDDAIDAAF